ncbi:hypothetical protein ABIF81_005791 [Bradyrhizobium daqingense]
MKIAPGALGDDGASLRRPNQEPTPFEDLH